MQVRPAPPLLAVFVAVVAVVAALPARAVVIQTPTGTGNTTPPADDPGFANVGRSANGLGSAIYLGEGWVLTANHVGGGGIVLPSGTFFQKAGSGFSLMTGTSFADLYMYQLQTTPTGLPTLAISSSMPGVGTPVTMIGAGLDRGAFTQWNVNTNTGTNPWIWTVTGSGGNAAGYGTLLDSRATRWGTNNVSQNDVLRQEYWGLGTNDFYLTKSLVTRFDQAPGTTEAQAVLRDSGGAVFTKTSGQWRLTGMIFSVAGFSGQPNPAFHAVFGNETFIADLSFYRPQIVAVVPEPSAAALVAGGVGAWAVIRRRWRRGPRRAVGDS